MPKAGNERTGPLPLHPMTMSDILDGAFKLYKANATSVLLVAATFVVPVQLVIAFLQRNTLGGRSIFNAFTSDTTAQSDDAVRRIVVVYGGAVVAAVALALIGCAVSRIVAASYLGGEESPGHALAVTATRAWAVRRSGRLGER